MLNTPGPAKNPETSAAAVSSRAPTVRAYLIGLVLACLVPGIIGSMLLLYYSYQSERRQQERSTIEIARALTQAVDAELAKAAISAQGLANSGNLASRNFAAFHAEAVHVIRQTGVGSNIVLSDEAGQQLVNTLRPPGSPLPRHGNLPQLRLAIESGRPVISDIYIGGVLRRHLMSIDAPVMHGDRIVYVISIGIFPEQFGSILRAQRLSPDWVVSIFDSRGIIAHRTHGLEAFVGKPGAPELLKRMAETTEGMVQANTLEGIPVSGIFSRSPITRWSVAIGIPTREFRTELWQRLQWLLVAVIALLVLSTALASLLAARITRPIRALVAPAMALGSGNAVGLPQLRLREANEVVTALAKASELLTLRTLASNVYQNITDGIFATDPGGRMISVNPALCRMTGYTAGELVGANLRILKATRQSPEVYEEIWQAVDRDGTWQGDIWSRRKDGSLFLARQTISAIRDAAGGVQHYVAVLSDVTETREQQQLLDHQAHHDPLTGLPNRLMFMNRLGQEIARAQRLGSLLGLLFLDLDRFKEVNDRFGHDAGDELLKEVAARLSASVRESDVVARLGGDEFTVILHDLTTREDAARVAQKLCDEMTRAFIIQREDMSVSASIGIALYPGNADGAAELIKAADEAMYEAKGAGRNAWRFATASHEPPA